jgi:hypothetical protein
MTQGNGLPQDGGTAEPSTEGPLSSDGGWGAEPPRLDKKCQSRNERRFEKKQKKTLLQRQGKVEWSRQQKRLYHRTKTFLRAVTRRNLQGYFGALTTAPGGDPSKLSAHFKELRRRIQRWLGYRGELLYMSIITSEGNGVLHPLIFWSPAREEKSRYFDLAPEWIQEQWSEIHGAPITKLRRYRAGQESEKRLSNYIVTQYLIQQQKAGEEGELVDALERYAWSWKKLFAFPVGKTWTELKQFWFARTDIQTWVGVAETVEALPFSWLISAWERICDGEKVRVENTYIWASLGGLDSCRM